ncbi:hypothetical protein LCGC14_1334990, partial [marine sediment metagenome]
MKSEDDERFTGLMCMMAENFNDEISEAGLKMRFGMLQVFTIKQVEMACKKILATRTYNKMPPIAEFIKAIQGPTPQIEDIAETQANFVISQVRKLGSWRTPVFVDPITRDLMNTRFNFTSLCQQTESDMQWFAKQFKIAYRTCIAMDEGNKRIEMTGKLKKLVSGIGG